MTETRSQNLAAIHRYSVKFRGGICRFKTISIRIFARKTFLRFRCSSIHVKMRVLLTYSARNCVQTPCLGRLTWLVPAVSTMSAAPTCDTEKQ